ncbi:MAG TPA: hypothetical protein VJN18_08510 [Polyangiaceae bacterium]|nr:hypothetical protein [Polyangiaceae bacterium]
MASSNAFPPREYGSGAHANLTQADRAFLDSPPMYEESASALASLPAPALPAPSLARSLLSKLLFVMIAGSACAVLVLAVMRMLGHPVELFR